jgi:hypothetical protein
MLVSSVLRCSDSCQPCRSAGAVQDGPQGRRAAARSVLDRGEHRQMMIGVGGTEIIQAASLVPEA